MKKSLFTRGGGGAHYREPAAMPQDAGTFLLTPGPSVRASDLLTVTTTSELTRHCRRRVNPWGRLGPRPGAESPNRDRQAEPPRPRLARDHVSAVPPPFHDAKGRGHARKAG